MILLGTATMGSSLGLIVWPLVSLVLLIWAVVSIIRYFKALKKKLTQP